MNKQTVALVITVFNRPRYFQRCVDTLKRLTVNPDLIVIIDDCSTDPGITPIIDQVMLHFPNAHAFRNGSNVGVTASLKKGIEFAFGNGCDLIINLDGDAIVKPNFIERLVQVHNEHDNICSGFNCDNKRNPILQEFPEKGVIHRHYCNGINMCFNREQYNKYIAPTLTTTGNWDFNSSVASQKEGKPIVITVPSLVQHIGLQSTMGHIEGDFAMDYKLLSLPSVTLFGIDAHNPMGILRAADICQEHIEFGDVKIITERLFPGTTTEEGRRNYSKFMIKDVAKYIDTEHMLHIHADGYIQNYEAWDNLWLKYDYIGAPWHFHPDKKIGNGGFSLRSKKLLDILASDDYITLYHPEDEKIGRDYRPYLENKYDIKFAPIEVAERFSIEAWGVPHHERKYDGQLGFHGFHVHGLPIPIKL